MLPSACPPALPCACLPLPQKERTGDIVDKSLVRGMTQMLVDLGHTGGWAGGWGWLGGGGVGWLKCTHSRRTPLNALRCMHCFPSAARHARAPRSTCPSPDGTAPRTAPGPAAAAVYCEDFEAPFLERTAEFYRAEAADVIASCDCPAYLAHAERRLGEEGDRVGAMLDASTEPKVIKVGGWVAGWLAGWLAVRRGLGWGHQCCWRRR